MFINGVSENGQVVKFEPSTETITVYADRHIRTLQTVQIDHRVHDEHGLEINYNRCLERSLSYSLSRPGYSWDQLVLYVNDIINDGRPVTGRFGDCTNIVRFVERFGVDVYVQYKSRDHSSGMGYSLGPIVNFERCIFIVAYGDHFCPFVEVGSVEKKV